jgi:NADP-dependent 3-hydroxy acid dehydrogenase YdfG
MTNTDSTPQNKVLLITGASTGIGAETARTAVAEGWLVALAARSQDKLEALVDELGPDVALAVSTDVTQWDEQEAMVEATIQRFGRIDAAFANAGFGAERGFLNSTPDHWREMILTNIYGCALTIRATLPQLMANKGHCVITSSVAGRRVLPGSLYSASKWAVTAMGEALRQEVADSGVRVTLIEPGIVDTPFFDDGTPNWALTAPDVARTVMFALNQPDHVDIGEILIRPTAQTV